MPAAALTLGLVFVPMALAGSGGPSLSIDPTSWTAGQIDAGTTASQTFTLTNTGKRSSGTLGVSLSGSDAFSITADGCTGKALGPARTCSVTVQYAPMSDGESDTATLDANLEHASATSASLSGSSTSPNPFPQSQTDCVYYGGTFSTDPSSDGTTTGFPEGDTFGWSCNGITLDPIATFDAFMEMVIIDCLGTDGGHQFYSFGTYNTCWMHAS